MRAVELYLNGEVPKEYFKEQKKDIIEEVVPIIMGGCNKSFQIEDIKSYIETIKSDSEQSVLAIRYLDGMSKNGLSQKLASLEAEVKTRYILGKFFQNYEKTGKRNYTGFYGDLNLENIESKSVARFHNDYGHYDSTVVIDTKNMGKNVLEMAKLVPDLKEGVNAYIKKGEYKQELLGAFPTNQKIEDLSKSQSKSLRKVADHRNKGKISYTLHTDEIEITSSPIKDEDQLDGIGFDSIFKIRKVTPGVTKLIENLSELF